tara:strand:- start:2903 stop:3955 length:1053 start_codon:yes stop_codon:yes gene_type:complete
MANNTFVGFLHAGHSTSPGDPLDSDQVHEIQPVTTWSRSGNYTVIRRWRGPVDSLELFSSGGSSNKDYAGTYFTAGGAGIDGAIATDLVRDEGGQLGIFSATWVTSNLAAAKWTGVPVAPATRGSATGDQFQESSLWTLDGNDLEKSIWESKVMLSIINAIASIYREGFSARVKNACDLYLRGKDLDNNPIVDYGVKPFLIDNYLGTASGPPLDLLSGAQLQTLGEICVEYMKGVEAFTISQYVLRNTKTTQYTSAVAATAIVPYYADINKIWLTSDVTALMTADTRPIDPPITTVNFDLPLIGVLGTVFSTSKWLYRTPDVQELSNGKWQITREWWESEGYSEILYEEK